MYSEKSFESSRASFKLAQGIMDLPGVLSFVMNRAEEMSFVFLADIDARRLELSPCNT